MLTPPRQPSVVEIFQAELVKGLLQDPNEKPKVPSLVEFFNKTTTFKAEWWQEWIANRLQRLLVEKGQRILLHAMPQAGKSILVSNRFPAYVLGCDPLHRIRLACYGQEHAEHFSRDLLSLMQDDVYKECFPNPQCRLPRVNRVEEWSTVARVALRDAQPSFKPLGLGSGFTGLGVDCLPAGTLVETEDGPVDIRDLHLMAEKPRVWACDIYSGKPDLRSIVASREVQAEALVEVRTEGGRRLRCTPDHRVFVQGVGYLPASELTVGAPLVGYLHHPDSLESVEACAAGPVAVYDLQVAEHCNFYASGLLVHNCLIIDDPYKNAEEAHSEVINGIIWRWWTDVVKPRLRPETNVVVCFHRWCQDDFAGKLEQDGDWEKIRFPALCDGGEDDPTFVEGIRKEGESLSPSRYPVDFLVREYKDRNPESWYSLYQGTPIAPGGNWFQVDRILPYDTIPEGLVIYQGWDLAFTQKSYSDYTACVTIGVDEDANAYILHVLRERWTPAQVKQGVLDMAKAWKPAVIGIESQGWQSQVFKDVVSEGLFPFLECKVKNRDKQLRAQLLRTRIETGKVLANKSAPWWSAFQEELLAFPLGKHDDQVDAAVWALTVAGLETEWAIL